MKAQRRFLFLTIMVVSIGLLPGCWVYSLHPLYEDGDKHLTYDSSLEGTWRQTSGDFDCLLVITRDTKEQEYQLKYAAPPENKDGSRENQSQPDSWEEAGPFLGHLVQFSSSRFLDVLPKNQNISKLSYIPGHSIFKLSVEGRKLSLAPPSDDWLCREANKLAIGECGDGPYNDFIFTASTPALQDFVQKHANNAEVFPKSDSDFDFYRVEKPGGSK